MIKTCYLKFLLLLFIVPTAYGQKVKYKDIFALLGTKQYELAEPFLKRYLRENDDNPNAFLYMAVIYQEKAEKIDVLKKTPEVLMLTDSAIFFYNKCNSIIDEREVRRNKEYYQAYNRRDLRTGEFGVKLSDIQFDIQKKTEALRERIDKVKMLKHYFSLADTLYQRSHDLFIAIRKTYQTEQQLYLRSNDSIVNVLQTLSLQYDSCIRAFDTYKASASNLGDTGYNQALTIAEIDDYENDGATSADFYKDEVKIWDYKKFADKARATIEKDVLPMKEHLVAYDKEINKLRDKLNSDSVSVRNDLTKLIDVLLFDQLKKFDPEPLPMKVFSLKIADLEYRSARMETKAMGDTADVNLEFSLAQTEMNYLDKMDSIAHRLSSEDIDRKALDYMDFVANTYGDTGILKSYIKTLTGFAEEEKLLKDAELAMRTKALNWIIDGADSIPLLSQDSVYTYRSIFTEPEKYTFGVHLKDSLNAEGYFYTITPSRKPDMKVVFPVDKTAFKERNLSDASSLSYVEGAGQLYFVLLYSRAMNKEKYPATLAKIYRTDGLAWSNNFQLSFVPEELLMRPDTGELVIKNETQQVVIDKNGKMLR